MLSDPVSGLIGGCLIGKLSLTREERSADALVDDDLSSHTITCFLFISLYSSGLAASVLLIFNGDIMGMSGILTSSILGKHDGGSNWKLAYLGTFLVTTQLMMFYPYIKVPDPEVQDYIPIASPIAHVLAGLFVGFGTKVRKMKRSRWKILLFTVGSSSLMYCLVDTFDFHLIHIVG